MRELVENSVIQTLDEMAAEDIELVEATMDLDMGFWNAVEDPPMTKEVYTDIVKKLSDNELLELYSYLIFGG